MLPLPTYVELLVSAGCDCKYMVYGYLVDNISEYQLPKILPWRHESKINVAIAKLEVSFTVVYIDWCVDSIYDMIINAHL